MNITFTPFEFKQSPGKKTMDEYIREKMKKNRNVPSFGEDKESRNFFKELPSRMSIGTVNDKTDLLESRNYSDLKMCGENK